MTVASKTQQSKITSLAADPGASDAVVMLIDPTSGVVEEASRGAIAWFGSDPVGAAGFDRAMPAMTAIADVAMERVASPTTARPLLFWTPAGPRQVTARLERVLASDGRVRVLVTTQQSAQSRLVSRAALLSPATERVAPRPSRAGAETPRVELARGSTRTDTETLREIARRIREGHTQRLVELEPVPQLAAPMPTPSDIATPAQQPPAAEPSPLVRSPPPQPASGVPANDHAKLAHELRTPLSAIAALADVMHAERLGPMGNARYRGYAGDIHASAQHALSVIVAMLSTEPPAQHQPQLEFVDLDVSAVASECAAAMAPLAAQKGIALNVVAAERLPRVVADRRTVKQILLNLISNALQATEADGTVDIAVAYEVAGPVRLEVRDTGSGMTDEQIGRIFSAEPGADTRGGERAGFGLPLVIAMADANGAAIAIGSRPGEGTRVSVVFDKDRVVPV